MAAVTPLPFGNLAFVDPFSGAATGAAATGFVGTSPGLQGSRVRFLAFVNAANLDTFTANLGNVIGVGWFGGTASTANQNCPTFAMSPTTDGQQQTVVTFNSPGASSGVLMIVSGN